MFAVTAGFAGSSRFPNTSSDRETRVTDSTEVLATVTVKVTVPPGSGRMPGSAVLVTSMVGVRSPKVTVASSSSEAGLPSSSITAAVTVSRWAGSPTSPATKALKEQEKVPPTGMAAGRDGQVLADTAGFAGSNRFPNTSSDRETRVTRSTEVFATWTVKVTVPPGSGTVPTDGVLEVVIDGATSAKATIASSSSEAGLPRASVTAAVTVL